MLSVHSISCNIIYVIYEWSSADILEVSGSAYIFIVLSSPFLQHAKLCVFLSLFTVRGYTQISFSAV
jgi:hypothetical protein